MFGTYDLTLLLSERPKLYAILAFLSAVGLNAISNPIKPGSISYHVSSSFYFLQDDTRPHFVVSMFGFLKDGTLTVNVTKFSVSLRPGPDLGNQTVRNAPNKTGNRDNFPYFWIKNIIVTPH